MIFVDSSVWIDYLRGLETVHTRKLDSILGDKPVVIGDLVLVEVLQGCVDPRQFEETVRLFRRLDVVTVGGNKVALEAARNHLKLRSKGFTVRKTIDCLIATRCILSGYELLHNDRDFLPFEKHLNLRCTRLGS